MGLSKYFWVIGVTQGLGFRGIISRVISPVISSY